MNDCSSEHRPGIDQKNLKNPQLIVKCTLSLPIHLVRTMESKHKCAIRIHWYFSTLLNSQFPNVSFCAWVEMVAGERKTTNSLHVCVNKRAHALGIVEYHIRI